MTSTEIQMYIATAVFVVSYGFIISERFGKTTVALVGAGVMIILPAIDAPDVFYSQETGIDWDVIFLMLGMMVIVSILRHTGVFEFGAIWAAKRARGSPMRIMIMLTLVMALASALLPNVVSVLLIAPVTLLVCDRLEINPIPMLIAEVFASNIGGTATLVGDPPNIIIGARKGLSFNAFLFNMAPIVVIILLVFVAVMPLMFRGFSTVSRERVADVMTLDEREVLNDRRLLVKCGAVMGIVFIGFIVSPTIHIQPSLIALLGAGALILASKMEKSDYLDSVEWDTLLFIVGLFVMVGALLKTGAITPSRRVGGERHRRQHAVHHDDGPRRVDGGVRADRQRPLRGDDDADRHPLERRHAASGPPQRVVVVVGARWRLGRQSHRRRIQRQHRDDRNRATLRAHHLVLGLHPQRHRDHHDVGRAVCALSVVAILRTGLGVEGLWCNTYRVRVIGLQLPALSEIRCHRPGFAQLHRGCG